MFGELLMLGVKRPRRDLLHLIPSLRIKGTTRPFLHTSSWNAKRQNFENFIALDTSELPAALLLLELMLEY